FGGFEDQGGQGAAGIGTRIDADAVVAPLRAAADAVAMNDDRAVIGLRVEERLADPQHVLAALSVEGGAGADAGMHEVIAAELVAEREAPEEGQMARRQPALEGALHLQR